jgi:outer membrane murein-binding lipoprotein Lpp
MKSKSILIIFLVFMIGTFIFGCASNTPTGPSGESETKLAEKEAMISQLIAEKEELKSKVAELQGQIDAAPGTQSSSLLSSALTVVELLQAQDMSGLSAHVHPAQGVRFAPYGYIDVQDNLVFSAQDIATLLASSQVNNWGAFDGTGDPIDFTFADYFDRFVYDQDFADPHMIGNNTLIGAGNTLININQAYPNGSFVEFHFTGFDSQYLGMDWKSLRLVFEELNGSWFLVGIVHDEWTI